MKDEGECSSAYLLTSFFEIVARMEVSIREHHPKRVEDELQVAQISFIVDLQRCADLSPNSGLEQRASIPDFLV